MSEGASTHHEWDWSPWPLVVSVGMLFMLPLAFSFYFVYAMPVAAILCLGLGVPLVVASIIGWTTGALQDRKMSADGQMIEPGYGIKAIPFFILAEAFIFIAFIVSYWALRLMSESWPPEGTPHIGYVTPIIMTVLLVASSITIHFAEEKLEHNDRGGFISFLVVTIVLGAAFMVLSINEWSHLMGEGFNFSTNIYGSSFFSITGFHLSHVAVGLSLFICILIPAFRGNISKTFVKSASVYWHFVDIIWFFVVSQIYFW